METKARKHIYKIRVPLDRSMQGIATRAFRIALKSQFPRAKVTLVEESPSDHTVTVVGFDREIMGRYLDYRSGNLPDDEYFRWAVCNHVLLMRACLMHAVVDDECNALTAEAIAQDVISMADICDPD